MAISQSRKWNMIGLGGMLLAGVLVGWSPFIAARWQMHRFCADLKPGTAAATISAQAAAAGYESLSMAEGVVRVQDPRSMGRYTCDLRFDDKGLASAAE